ncbi:DUF7383 domain-containing protein [Haloarcula litorea]|uniref:DUF7383 domain-containing protein n=1 Tax=Haloarcula litorea TaxID=3032579 RepID=UPI0023E815F4|nr:hypothetical protein [Halomicroarcula sp. GDY20]
MSHRANYARCQFLQHLGPDADSLAVPWAEFTGDRTDPVAFEVPTATPTDPYVEVQVYDVGDYDHDILLNGRALSGFDLPPAEGWQYWMDAVADTHLQGGENTLAFERADTGEDAFVVGVAVVNWKEPVE